MRSRKLAAGEGSDLDSNDFEGEAEEAAAAAGFFEDDTAIARVNADEEADEGGTAIGEEEEPGGTANGEVGMTKDKDDEVSERKGDKAH